MTRATIWAIFLFASFTVISNSAFTDSVTFIISIACSVFVTIVNATSLVAFLAHETFVAYTFAIDTVTVNTAFTCF